MKTILTLLLTCLVLTANGKSTFQKLAEVNACWRLQADANLIALPTLQPKSEREWIRLHLELVTQALRSRSVAHLTPAQQEARRMALDNLQRYREAGVFPVNEDYAYRTPIFIDKHNNFCAVGYLVKASGHEEVARMIASQTNTAYVMEMAYPALDAWAAANGFTKEELAWIQPGYPAEDYTAPIGKGVDGEVRELLAIGDTLYAGGSFTHADSTLNAANIACITESGGAYTWHTMGSGVNGPVNAIAKYNNRIYIAGAFTMAGDSAVNNVAYWEGGQWHTSGCLYGEVKDLVVFGNRLYAAGSFDVCASAADINFARLSPDEAYWQQLPGLSGHINTMEVLDTTLVLGGAFRYAGDTVNAMRWSPAGGFQPFLQSTRNEVMDFERYGDTLYAGCKWLPGGDSTKLFLKLRGAYWTNTFSLNYSFSPGTIWFPGVAFRTLVGNGNYLMLGGTFGGVYGMDAMQNCVDITPYYYNSNLYYSRGPWFAVDNTIYKMAYYKGELIAGGSFRKGMLGGIPSIQLNGMAKRKAHYTTVPGVSTTAKEQIYPNPVAPGGQLTIAAPLCPVFYSLTDVTGKSAGAGALNGSPAVSIALPLLAPGLYFLTLRNGSGFASVHRITVR